MHRALRVAVLTALATVLPAQNHPVVSEIMASNYATLADEDGDTPDYIELHNPTSTAVDLGGWFLTDDRNRPKKWTFPRPTSVAAGGFLVVFASSKSRAIVGRQLHTSFSLKSDGEYVGLADLTGKIVSDLGASYPRQYPDVAYGLEFGATVSSKRTYLPKGTPGAPNGLGAAVVGNVWHQPNELKATDDCVVTAHLLNPNNAKVNSVTLSYRVNFGTETGIAMRDDGKAPDPVADDDLWTGTIPASRYVAGQMLRWRVRTSVQGGVLSTVPVHVSATNSPAYFGTAVQDPAGRGAIRTFHWWVQDAWRANTRTGTRCSVWFEGEFYENVFVRIRGGSSTRYPKQSYKFDFNRGYRFAHDPSAPRVDEINLNTTWADKAFVRQIIAYETFRDAGGQSSVVFPIRQQQNGKFFMVSVFTEQVDADYLKRQGFDDRGALYKVYNSLERYSSTRLEQKIASPAGTSDIRALISAINGTATRDRYLWDNVDLPACINYWAGIVLMHDNDSVHKNYYLYRDHYGDGEWRFLPWDKDLVYGRNYTNSVLNDTIWAERDPQSHPLFGDSSHRKIDGFYNRLVHAMLSEPRVRAMYLRRLRTLMDGLLQDSTTPKAQRYYEKRIAALEKQMAADVALDKAKWGVPAYGDRTLDFHKAIDVLESQYLDRRRRHLFRTHSALIPKRQAAHGLYVRFGSVEHRPVSNNIAEQFVEVVNGESTAIDLSGWSLFGAGIEFRFESGTVVSAGGSVFVAARPKAFRARTTGPRGGEKRFVVGPFDGVLQGATGLVVYDARGFPVTATGEFGYALTTQGNGDVTIAIDKAAASTELYILFSADNSGRPGSGPILGLGADVLWQIGLPLGAAPIHVRTDGAGRYAYALPNNSLPKGLQLTSRAVYVDARGRLVVSDVQRRTF